MNQIKIGLVGSNGRMGERVSRCIANQDGLVLTQSFSRPDWQRSPERACDVVIDYSAPPAATDVAAWCEAHHVPWICASTGLEPDHERAIDKAAKSVAVVQAANFSLGINVMSLLVTEATRLLADYDVEMFDFHHRYKRDAPSGTALMLADAVEAARTEVTRVVGRQGKTERKSSELGVSVARGGTVAGEHTVFFCGESERIELTHRASNADVFADGALFAARWVLAQPAGRYAMRDVLSL